MTSEELRTNLIAWIKAILTEQGQGSLQVISSHQNAPSPGAHYITVKFGPNRDRFGRASKGDVQDDGTRLLVSDWVGTVELWETNGEGDLLRILMDSLDREDIYHAYFVEKSIVHYNQGEIAQVPRLDNESWIREAMVEMTLGLAEGTRETTSWIDTVDYSGDIGGLQE